MKSTLTEVSIRIRGLERSDLDEVIRIDSLHTGHPEPEYWRDRFGMLSGKGRIALAAETTEPPNDERARLSGYLLGEIRAFEFGSPPCGWVFAVGVDPRFLRRGVASLLLEESCRRFRSEGVMTIRTMVRRSAIPVLSFFRSQGFVGGPFVQLERDLEDEP